jgi:hypothetical protein
MGHELNEYVFDQPPRSKLRRIDARPATAGLEMTIVTHIAEVNKFFSLNCVPSQPSAGLISMTELQYLPHHVGRDIIIFTHIEQAVRFQ